MEALNEQLLAKAHENKVVKTDKLRADTTVIPANVAYPTDSGLLAKGVAKMAAAAKKLKGLGLAARTTTRDRTRSVRRRAHDVAVWLRRRNGDAKQEVLAITGELADIAEAAVAEARTLSRNARRGLARRGEAASGKAKALVADLERTASLMEQIIAQTRLRLAGEVPDGASRVVSLHDADARPIKKGRLGKPCEFGFKGQVVDNVDGIVVDHLIVKGNPPDAPMLKPAIERVKARFGRAPKAVTADRGYGEAGVDAGLEALGVKQVAIPRKGKPGAARRQVQNSRRFRTLVKWRTGSEGRVSALKHNWEWGRSLMDGETGAQTWCGWGVLAHNSVKISGLIETKNNKKPTVAPRTPPSRPRLGPRAADHLRGHRHKPLPPDPALRLSPSRPTGPEGRKRRAGRSQKGRGTGPHGHTPATRQSTPTARCRRSTYFFGTK